MIKVFSVSQSVHIVNDELFELCCVKVTYNVHLKTLHQTKSSMSLGEKPKGKFPCGFPPK